MDTYEGHGKWHKYSETDRHSRAKAISDKKVVVGALLSLGCACRTEEETEKPNECDLVADQVLSQDMHTMSISTLTELTSYDIKIWKLI